jgi:small subunit ribosomal protein S20
MPNVKSAKKRMKQNVKRRERNRQAKAALKTATKKADEALNAADKAGALEIVKAAVKKLDKTASKGIIHPNKAARKKSRLMKKLNKQTAEA